ncbi:MAG: alpha-ketoacid dehydrogenase subunit beta [Desulfobacterales bacterium]
MRKITFREAITETLDETLQRDPSVLLFGEDIGLLGGAFQATKGLWQKYGERRVRNTPISEAAIIGAAIGTACTGLKPIAEIMFCDFLYVGMDQIVNQMAKMKYMYGGKAVLPIVIRTTCGAGLGGAAQHSQSNEAMFAHVSGLKVVVPSTPKDAKGLLRSAIADPNPVLFFEDHRLYDLKAEVPDDDYTIPLGLAEVKREGTDLTIVAAAAMVDISLDVAEELAKAGISIEVVDPRTVSPLDMDTINKSVMKTKRLIVTHEAPVTCGVGAEIAARIQESAFGHLKAPVKRVCGKDSPIPCTPVLEKFVMPQKEDIVNAAKALVA